METTEKRSARILRFSEFCEAIDGGGKQGKRPRLRLRQKRLADQSGGFDGAGDDSSRTDAGTFVYAMELIPEP